MSIFIIMFLLSLATTAVGTPLVRRLAIWLGFVDMPASRKLHAEPMPLMGGVAIFGGALFAFFLFFTQFTFSRQVAGILGAMLLVGAVGLVDDKIGLRPRTKLIGQILGVAILILTDVYVQLPIPMWVNYLITLFWVVGISNALNLLDNMDGLSAGVSGVAAAFIVLLATAGGQALVAALGAAVLGACLGFLRYNFKPAQIFMGDAGALFLGFLLAVLGLQLRFLDNTPLVTWMVPVLILGVPVFDTTLVVISRGRRGRNPFTTPGKDHISHRLVELGFSQREAVLILYLFCGMFGLTALFVAQSPPFEAYAVALLVATLSLYCIWWLERRRSKGG
ncbi:MAG: undecaprenyl/decaprenyl-phosphate alpha-N-acetylglucosaminyl 1-phosphate transferase [Chloroflexi bacterium]|nr:undecaprenyl/decaprenyl-phosphate alpha-N-acetylglucosaminyl 1-phosphate transferase [Chloroflexota bacterium]